MTEPTSLWPAPPPRRGSKIKHSWRCSRRGTIAEGIRTDPTGQAVVVEICLECQSTDPAERLLADRDGGDAA